MMVKTGSNLIGHNESGDNHVSNMTSKGNEGEGNENNEEQEEVDKIIDETVEQSLEDNGQGNNGKCNMKNKKVE
jgi:hypothetical protein